MIGPLVLLWLMGSGKRGSPAEPSWPDRKHPPPNVLPDSAAASPAPAPAHAHHRAANTSHAPRPSSHVEIGPAEILHNDAAPPAPSAAVPPTIPAERMQAERAAAKLYDYVRKAIAQKQGSLLGTKGRPNAYVARAQEQMGLKPDGIYGPATRARGRQLLSKDFPARVSGEDRPLYIP